MLDSGRDLHISITLGSDDVETPQPDQQAEQQTVMFTASTEVDDPLSYLPATTITREDELQQHHSLV